MLKRLLVGTMVAASGSVTAQTTDALILDPLLVTSPRSESDWLTLPMAVSTRSALDQPGEQLLTLDSLLGPVPGVVSQSRYNLAQGMRLSIRGFGARSSFGVRGAIYRSGTWRPDRLPVLWQADNIRDSSAGRFRKRA